MKLALLLLLAVGCGGAAMHTVSLTNSTERTIKELYVYPAGSKDKGPSRGSLAPTAATSVQMKAGAVEVYAVSETMKIDERTRDTPTASQGLELTSDLKVIFYDGDQPKPAAVNQPGVIGVSFIVAAKPAPASDPATPAP
jgi:hypothetical protein